MSKCGYKVTKNHEYEGNNCKDCGATKPQEECTIIGYKRMIQQIIGKNVQSVEKLKIKEHTLWQQQEIMEMAHYTKTCTKCNYKVTSNHSYNSSNKCKDCGVTKPQRRMYT